MKTYRLKIKISFYHIARYLYVKLQASRKTVTEIYKRYSTLVNDYSNLKWQLAKEKEYNLNVRMRRRNHYWRKQKNGNNK